MKRLFLVLAGLFAALLVFAQTDTLHLVYSVRGKVTDARSGKPLEAVHVSLTDRYFATVTNADGEFTLKSDRPIGSIRFSFLGYRTLIRRAGDGLLKVSLTPEAMPLEGARIVSGDPVELLHEAISRIPDNYSTQPELLRCFYRETVRKRLRFTYISEAVARIYKTGYDEQTVIRDRAALEKSRILLSQRAADTLSVKMMGGPTQALTLDVVKNAEILFSPDEMTRYRYTLDAPAQIGDRPQYVIRMTPGPRDDLPDALYYGTIYIDQETLAFTRIELSMDMSDPARATWMILIRKPFRLRFTPKEASIIITYRSENGKSRIDYLRSTLRFNCDWRKKLFSTSYTVVNELVVTDLIEPVVPIPRAQRFRPSDILNDKAAEFLDPDFWLDYNIIEPTESLENAIGRLKKQRKP